MVEAESKRTLEFGGWQLHYEAERLIHHKYGTYEIGGLDKELLYALAQDYPRRVTLEDLYVAGWGRDIRDEDDYGNAKNKVQAAVKRLRAWLKSLDARLGIKNPPDGPWASGAYVLIVEPRQSEADRDRDLISNGQIPPPDATITVDGCRHNGIAISEVLSLLPLRRHSSAYDLRWLIHQLTIRPNEWREEDKDAIDRFLIGLKRNPSRWKSRPDHVAVELGEIVSILHGRASHSDYADLHWQKLLSERHGDFLTDHVAWLKEYYGSSARTVGAMISHASRINMSHQYRASEIVCATLIIHQSTGSRDRGLPLFLASRSQEILRLADEITGTFLGRDRRRFASVRDRLSSLLKPILRREK